MGLCIYEVYCPSAKKKGQKLQLFFMTLQTKTTILDIEPKLDKNGNPFYRLSLAGFLYPFYAFSFNLSTPTLQSLKETPEKLINQPVLITYEELSNKDNQGTFFKVKEIEILL